MNWSRGELPTPKRRLSGKRILWLQAVARSGILGASSVKRRPMYYILFYDYIKDVVTKRAPFRDAHLGIVRQLHKDGVIVMAGAYDNPLDGTAIVFKCETQDSVERFVKMDPYVVNSLVTKWRIREWSVVIGGTS